MTRARILSLIGLTVLWAIITGAVTWGFIAGNGWEEVGELMDYPWFVVSLYDVYTGFILFSIWIVARERSWVAAPWIIALMLLGNIVSCMYAALAIITSKGDLQKLWMGRTARS